MAVTGSQINTNLECARHIDAGTLGLELGNVNHNRFLLLDQRHQANLPDQTLSFLAEALCQSSVVDDMLVLQPSQDLDARYRVIGGDGREADFCVNGALYVLKKLAAEAARYHRPSAAEGMCIETRVGNKKGFVEGDDIFLEMECVADESIRQASSARQSLNASGSEIIGIVRAGEPHLVVSAPDYLVNGSHNQLLFDLYCQPLCDSVNVEGGINITMVFANKPGFVEIKTFERGARRLTASCGSGAIAAGYAVRQAGMNDHDAIKIVSPGGAHNLIFDEQRCRISLDSSWESGRGAMPLP